MSAFAASLALIATGVLNFDAMPTRIVQQPEAEEVSETEIIQGGRDREKRMTVPVAVQGNGPYEFVIDTGSQRTVLSTDLASRLALEPGPTLRIIGVAGTEDVQSAYVEQLELGKREYSGLHAPLFESEHIGADGIIGTDSLQQQRVQIDFGKNQMEIGSRKSLGGNGGYEIIVTARALSGQLVMTDALIDGVRTAVVIDTGASYSVGNQALRRALAKRSNHGTVVLTSVTGQSTIAEIGFAKMLKLRDINISNLLVAYTESPAFGALGLSDKPALFLGMRELRVFKRIAIDFASHKVLFDIPKT